MPAALLHRLAESERPPLAFTLDGRPATARAGDSLLTAVLTNAARLRVNEFDGSERAGFCLMGACQDCWLRVEGRGRLRACTTLLEAGMSISTTPEPLPDQPWERQP